MNEIYTPMEKILVEGAKAAEQLSMKEVCDAALETAEKFRKALELDLMLLEAEEKVGLMDGIPVEA